MSSELPDSETLEEKYGLTEVAMFPASVKTFSWEPRAGTLNVTFNVDKANKNDAWPITDFEGRMVLVSVYRKLTPREKRLIEQGLDPFAEDDLWGDDDEDGTDDGDGE